MRGERGMFLPDMYQKNIYAIPYQKLKEKGIKCLVFDLDNTLRLIDEKVPTDKVQKLVHELEKDFRVLILSNSLKKGVMIYKDALGIEAIGHARKPSTKGLKVLAKRYGYQPSQIAMIGDQLVTDILAGHRFGTYTVYVDALSKKDLKITYLNRFIERRIINAYQRKGKFKRGVYYES